MESGGGKYIDIILSYSSAQYHHSNRVDRRPGVNEVPIIYTRSLNLLILWQIHIQFTMTSEFCFCYTMLLLYQNFEHNSFSPKLYMSFPYNVITGLCLLNVTT